MHRRKIQTTRQNFQQFFPVVSDTTARAAQGERRTNNHREADLSREFQPVFKIVDQCGLRHIQSNPLHGVFEEEPVFRFLNGSYFRTNELYVELVEHPAIGQLDSQIQRRLSAHGGQNGKAFLAQYLPLNPENLGQILACKRLEVSAVGKLRVGHDGRRVRVRQYYLVTFALQRLAGLGAGVIKLGRLPDHNRPRADNQDFRNVRAFRHARKFSVACFQLRCLEGARLPPRRPRLGDWALAPVRPHPGRSRDAPTHTNMARGLR